MAKILIFLPADCFQLWVKETDTVCREHLLGALQKLSLRRVVQSQMIRGGKVIPWLIENLSEPDNLSEYLLEYAAALLMNLCLRTTGRCSLLNETENLLRVLTDLLSHENQNFKTYLNGTLYSVLKMDKFKEKARAMGLKGLLDSYMKREQPDSEHYTVYRIIIFSLFFKYTYIATRLYQKRN